MVQFLNHCSIENPFLRSKLESIVDNDLCKDELVDLQSSTALYSTFMSCNREFSKIWRGLVEGFPMLTKRALEVIIQYFSKLLNCVRLGSPHL